MLSWCYGADTCVGVLYGRNLAPAVEIHVADYEMTGTVPITWADNDHCSEVDRLRAYNGAELNLDGVKNHSKVALHSITAWQWPDRHCGQLLVRQRHPTHNT